MVLIGVAAMLAVAGPAAALISETNVEDKIIEHEIFQNVKIENSDTTAVSISSAHVEGSHVGMATVEDVSIEKSYLNDLDLRRAYVENSRIEAATVEDSTLEDTTVCRAQVNLWLGFGDCEAISVKDGELESYGRLAQDAPHTIAPGESYDLELRDVDAEELSISNQPGGLVGLGFQTGADPLDLQSLGFEAAASDDSVESIELWDDGVMIETFDMGDEVELHSSDFMLRINTAESGIIDHSRLALVLDLDGHELRPAMTSFDVVATDLVIPPVEGQLFAPFLADNIARLVLSVAVDDNGNVDRDVNTTFEVEVLDVDPEGEVLVGDMQQRANLHDDSRLFSEAPFSYSERVTAAHHPQSLELLVRANLLPELEQGAINAYGTHLVAMGPHATDVRLDAHTTNANGETLNASIEIAMGATAQNESVETYFGAEFEMPGRGLLEVNMVDEMGAPVEAGENWSLFIHETPTSHSVRQSIAIDAGDSTVTQELAASKQVQTPLGNFASSEYLVCIDHDGERDCANGGDLVAIRTDETSSVDIVVS